METDSTPWRIDADPITRIGEDAADARKHFKSVVAAVRLSDGRVVVATEAELRWFDSTGAYLMTTTRDGDGPGEFRFIRSLYRQIGDTVLVADAIGRRVARFSPSGTLLEDIRLDEQRFNSLGQWRECDAAILPDGSRYSCQFDSSIPEDALNRPSRQGREGQSSPGVGRLRQLRRTYLVPPALDTAYPLGIVAGIEQFGVRVDNHETYVLHPFYSRSLIAAGGTPMRIVTMTNPEYRVEVWSATGVLERALTRKKGRRTPSADEVAAARHEMWLQSRKGLDSAQFERVLAAVPTPDSLPAAIDLVVSDRGEVIVQRDGFSSAARHSRFDVFDANGDWLGELLLKPRTRILAIDEHALVTIRIDDDDVPVVEVWRFHRELSAR